MGRTVGTRRSRAAHDARELLMSLCPVYRRRAGFTLVELLVSIGVMGLILTALAQVEMRSNAQSKSMPALDLAEGRARRARHAIPAQLHGVGGRLSLRDPS